MASSRAKSRNVADKTEHQKHLWLGIPIMKGFKLKNTSRHTMPFILVSPIVGVQGSLSRPRWWSFNLMRPCHQLNADFFKPPSFLDGIPMSVDFLQDVTWFLSKIPGRKAAPCLAAGENPPQCQLTSRKLGFQKFHAQTVQSTHCSTRPQRNIPKTLGAGTRSKLFPAVKRCEAAKSHCSWCHFQTFAEVALALLLWASPGR